jgi:hypothetical protein
MQLLQKGTAVYPNSSNERGGESSTVEVNLNSLNYFPIEGGKQNGFETQDPPA